MRRNRSSGSSSTDHGRTPSVIAVGLRCCTEAPGLRRAPPPPRSLLPLLAEGADLGARDGIARLSLRRVAMAAASTSPEAGHRQDVVKALLRGGEGCADAPLTVR